MNFSIFFNRKYLENQICYFLSSIRWRLELNRTDKVRIDQMNDQHS